MANRELSPWRGGQVGWPFEPFSSFRQEIDRLFDDFFAPSRGVAAPGGNGGMLRPSIEMTEDDKAYHVTAELPGLDMKDINLDLRENTLSISGEKKSEKTEQGEGTHYSERTYGRFERMIALPDEVDADKVDAHFKNGVLTIDLPKNPRAVEKARKIEIKPN
ncbi:MAG TPA: Hsp20/alpha crystallin family protein [Rhizomicrobium sp.]|nr:Hsp20/alpha crystallin family protein [Rhizomicrobium sp.]